MTTYTCKTCGAAATIVKGNAVMTCEHKDAGLIAHLKAVATGAGGVKS